jgi:hypothetical protein
MNADKQRPTSPMATAAASPQRGDISRFVPAAPPTGSKQTDPQICEVTLTTRCDSPKGTRFTMNIGTITEAIFAAIAATTPPAGPAPPGVNVNLKNTGSPPPGPVEVLAIIRLRVPVRDGTVDRAVVKSAVLGTFAGNQISFPVR